MSSPVTVNAHEITALETELKQVSIAVDMLPRQQIEHEAHDAKRNRGAHRYMVRRRASVSQAGGSRGQSARRNVNVTFCVPRPRVSGNRRVST